MSGVDVPAPGNRVHKLFVGGVRRLERRTPGIASLVWVRSLRDRSIRRLYGLEIVGGGESKRGERIGGQVDQARLGFVLGKTAAATLVGFVSTRPRASRRQVRIAVSDPTAIKAPEP